jgi:hypothetical protein
MMAHAFADPPLTPPHRSTTSEANSRRDDTTSFRCGFVVRRHGNPRS